MKVPFFDYPRVFTDDREKLLDIIDSVSSRGAFILQQELFDFEENLKDFTGSSFVVGVGNATDALEFGWMSIGLKPGDEIIISSHTMLATASAIITAGGKPIPVDIGSDNLIDPESIEAAITDRTVGISPTQLNGRTCNMDSILEIANKHDLKIVEDSAQALGSTFKGKHAGTFGVSGAISFFPAKVLGSLGDGGALLCNDEKIFHKVWQLHDHGRSKEGDVLSWGRNSRLDNLQAAILSYRLSTYNEVVKRRREIASIYHDRLSSLEELRLPPSPTDNPDHFDVYQNYELAASNRDALKDYLFENGIGTLIQWGGKAIHHFTNLGFDQYLPKTDAFFKECIMLPMNTFLSNDNVEYICEKVHAFYRS